MAFRFRRAFYRLVPSWLSSDEGEKVLYSMGLMVDLSAERLRRGLVARFPELTEDEDSLTRIGRDRLIPRGIAEPAPQYAARLVQFRFPKGHRVRGNAFAVARQIRAHFASIGDVKVRTVDVRGNWYTVDYDGTESYNWDLDDWDWDGVAATPRWGRFWVIVYTDLLAPTTQRLGDPDLWGGALGAGVGSLGDDTNQVGAPSISFLRTMLDQWKPGGTMPQHIILTSNPDLFQPGVTNETDGTWDVWSNRELEPGYIPYE